MKNTILITFLALGITANAQWFGKKRIKDNGNIITETRLVSDFEGIRVTGSFDVYLTKGAANKVEVEVSENILPYIITEVKNGVLKIGFKEGYNYQINEKLEVRVTAQPMKKIEVTGSGSVRVKENIEIRGNGRVILCNLSGSGNIELPLKANKVNVILSGSGDIKLSGTTDFLGITLNGSGDIKAYKLKTPKAKVALSGSGDISLYVSEEIETSIIGSGDIKVKGNPKRQYTSTMGSGRIAIE